MSYVVTAMMYVAQLLTMLEAEKKAAEYNDVFPDIEPTMYNIVKDATGDIGEASATYADAAPGYE